MKFARAVFCPGVELWYLRFGSQHGVDVMFKQRSENQAKLNERLINASLSRDLEKSGRVAQLVSRLDAIP